MSNRSRMQGLTLVELMVAMLLGLVVIGGAVSLTLANRQSYRTNEGLSQLQESARTAFELIARDIRQAGVSGCDNAGRISNVLIPVAGIDGWWMGWFGVRGHDEADDTSAVVFGTNPGDRVAGTDALQLQGIDGTPMSVESHASAGTDANMIVRAPPTNPVAGDVLIACDFDHAAIFRVTAYDSATRRIRHNYVDGTTPGTNCSRGLGFPTDCGSASGNAHWFAANSLVGRLFATDWYIGQNGRADEGGRSLYRRRLGGAGNLLTEEIVAGVTDMQVSYRRGDTNAFEAAGVWAASDWNDVNAIRIDLTVESADTRVSTDVATNQGRLSRDFSQIITLRNRVP